MKKILNHLVLAFMFMTQSLWFAGCTQTKEMYNCKCDCEKLSFECSKDEGVMRVSPTIIPN